MTSSLESEFVLHLRGARLPLWQQEYQFDRKRRWRFDFAWPQHLIAVELEGGTWTNGRHTRGAGFEKDCAKYNAAALVGWRVGRFTAGMVSSGEALTWISSILKNSS
jgi:hypothetical protein